MEIKPLKDGEFQFTDQNEFLRKVLHSPSSKGSRCPRWQQSLHISCLCLLSAWPLSQSCRVMMVRKMSKGGYANAVELK